MRNRKDGFGDFLDAFIKEAIESNGCYCGGGGKEDMLDVVVELGHRSGDPDKKRMKITAWLDGREDVQSWRIGPEFDVWLHIPEQVGHQFRSNPATDSVAFRPGIPVESGH